MQYECFMSRAHSTVVWQLWCLQHLYLHISSNSFHHMPVIYKLSVPVDWGDKNLHMKYLKQTIFFPLSIFRTAGRLQIYPSVQIYLSTTLSFSNHALIILAQQKKAASPAMCALPISVPIKEASNPIVLGMCFPAVSCAWWEAGWWVPEAALNCSTLHSSAFHLCRWNKKEQPLAYMWFGCCTWTSCNFIP